MDRSPAPLRLTPQHRGGEQADWRRRTPHLLAALALHMAPLALLLTALPLKPRDLAGAFGQSVSVTLVSTGPATVASAPAAAAQPSLASLERRLSDTSVPSQAAPAAAQPVQTTRLSDLLEPQGGSQAGRAMNAPPRPSTGMDDDPFARASVSYRGDDPEKAARLQAKARSCARAVKAARLLLIINSEGYLVARPRALGAAGAEKSIARTIAAVERCAPFADAASAGPPRSYEIEVG